MAVHAVGHDHVHVELHRVLVDHRQHVLLLHHLAAHRVEDLTLGRRHWKVLIDRHIGPQNAGCRLGKYDDIRLLLHRFGNDTLG